MSKGLKRLNEQSYSLGLNGNVMNPLVNIPFKRQNDEVALSGVQTFTRASTSTYIDPLDGLVKTATINTPRFEKMSDGGTGILMEGASTNQCTNSIVGVRSSVVPRALGIAPDGTTTAENAVKKAITDANILIAFPINVTSAIGTYFTLSMYMKPIGAGASYAVYSSKFGYLNRPRPETDPNAIYNPSTGYYRVSINLTSSGIGGSDIAIFHHAYATTTGNGIDGNYIWGVQLEALSFATSYIPTTTTAVTRAADNLSILASGNVPQIMSQHTIIADAETFGNIPGAAQIIASSVDGPVPDMHDLRILQANVPYAQSRFGDQLVTNSVNPIISNRVYRLAISNTGSSLVGYSDGTLIQASPAAVTSNIVPLSGFNIGSYPGGINPIYGHIRNFRIYDRALTAAEILVA